MAKRTPRCGLISPGNGGLICNLYANHPGDHAAAWKRTPYDKPCNDYAKPVYKPLGYGFVGGDQSKNGGFAGVKPTDPCSNYHDCTAVDAANTRKLLAATLAQ